MTPQKIVVTIAAALAIGVLGFLLYASREQPADAAPDEALFHIGAVAQAQTGFAQEILKSRLNADVEQRELAEARVHLAAARQRMFEAAWTDAVKEPLEAYQALAQEQMRLTDEHQIELRLFMGALQLLRRDTDAALSRLDPDTQASQRAQIGALAAEAAAQALRSETGDALALGRQLNSLSASAARADADTRAAFARLGETVKLLGMRKESLQVLTQRLLALPLPAALDRIEAAVFSGERLQRAGAVRYRRILPVYTIALLVAFGAIALRLRSSFRKLDEANASLRNSNVNLEKQVESRTAELRRALEDLRLQQAQLIQSEKMASLGQMVAGVAHEINTPLGYARSNLETVREALDGGGGLDAETAAEFRELLNDSDHGLGQISELVMSLKDFSRLDRSLTEPFDLNEGLDTSLKICNNQLKNRIEVERDYASLPPIPCAPSQLNQVFLNILTNAAQAIVGPGNIRVQTRDTGAFLCVAIRDSGCGMDADTKAHIFEPFFTTKDVGQGTGLGLSIVFRIVEDHGGRIEVDSAPGAGTEFRIFLPKQVRPRRAPGQTAPRTETAAAGIAPGMTV